MNQHQRSLSFPQVAANFFAILRVLPRQVQDVVLYLKSRAEVPTQPAELIPFQSSAPRDQCSNAQWIDERIPRSLLETHLKIIFRIQIIGVIANPTELDRLSLERVTHHSLGLEHHFPTKLGAENVAIGKESFEREQVCAVTYIHRDPNPVFAVQGWSAAPA